MSTNKKTLSVKVYPEIGKMYKHYKGGKYKVLTLAKHSEADEINDIFNQLDSMKLSDKAKSLINQLKIIYSEDLVVYKSIGFGSVHARPLKMWFNEITHEKYIEHFGHVKRFELIE